MSFPTLTCQRIGQNLINKCVENFALSYTFPIKIMCHCMKSIFSSSGSYNFRYVDTFILLPVTHQCVSDGVCKLMFGCLKVEVVP